MKVDDAGPIVLRRLVFKVETYVAEIDNFDFKIN